MGPTRRRQDIRRWLVTHGEVELAALATEFDVSEMTIRRDLKALEDEGVARCVRGGAVSIAARLYEPAFSIRRNDALEAKQAIAQAAMRLIDDGECLILDSGTTVLELAKALVGTERTLTVVTPSILAALELGREQNIQIQITGGSMRSGELSLIGPAAEDAFADINCDSVFLGVAGINLDRGLTEYNLPEARVKQAAIKSARRRVVLADARKLGRIHFANVMPLSEIDTLVTDAPEDHPTVVETRAAGVEVISTTAHGGLETALA